MKTLKFHHMKSPLGILKLVANDHQLVAILWDKEKPNRVKLEEMVEDSQHPILKTTEKQLNEYFRNERKGFELALVAHGTEFQKAVWKVLTQIPYGTTWTYKQVAEKINRPLAVRAVGTAIGRNPISIIIPCHRVIASNQGLGGFAGGLDRKRTLLSLEKELA
jgi:methylated-DNA-[protein]-cysteine S-methyltransferase